MIDCEGKFLLKTSTAKRLDYLAKNMREKERYVLIGRMTVQELLVDNEVDKKEYRDE